MFSLALVLILQIFDFWDSTEQTVAVKYGSSLDHFFGILRNEIEMGKSEILINESKFIKEEIIGLRREIINYWSKLINKEQCHESWIKNDRQKLVWCKEQYNIVFYLILVDFKGNKFDEYLGIKD